MEVPDKIVISIPGIGSFPGWTFNWGTARLLVHGNDDIAPLLHLSALVDEHTPVLVGSCLLGRHFPGPTTLLIPTGDHNIVLLRLTNVRITTAHLGGAEAGPARIDFTLRAEQVQVSFHEVHPDGGAGRVIDSRVFDLPREGGGS